MTEDFIDPTPESRRKLLWLIAAVLLLGALATYWLLPWFRMQMQVLPPCEAIRLARWALLVLLLSLPLIAMGWALPLAWRLWTTGQFPPPGTWVVRRKPIRRGRAVRIRAVALVLWSVLSIALAIWGAYTVQSVLPDRSVCQAE
ncbi:MAG: hypothetical protein R3F04_13830 [Lysobacteraceae bacterium]